MKCIQPGVMFKTQKSGLRRLSFGQKKGTTQKKMIEQIQDYLTVSNFYKRKEIMESAVSEFGWQQGYIYILTNEYMPDLIKVGRVYGAGRSAHDRVRDKDLNCTGVPSKFKVKFEMYTLNSREAENMCHKKLNRRIAKTEFLKGNSVSDAKTVIEKVIKEVDKEAFDQAYGPRQSMLPF